MQKEEVIKAIDKLIDLENQKQSILSKYQDVIIDYVKDYDSPDDLFFENCDYIRKNQKIQILMMKLLKH